MNFGVPDKLSRLIYKYRCSKKKGEPMKRKNRKSTRKHKSRDRNRSRRTRLKRRPRKHYRARRRMPAAPRKRVVITDPRVARGLGLMRREGASASEAARRERIKLKTFRKCAGK